MIELYFLSHYVMYKYYRKCGEDRSSALFAACCIQGIFVYTFIYEIMWFIGLTFDIKFVISKSAIVAFFILFLLFEYFVFYKGGIQNEWKQK